MLAASAESVVKGVGESAAESLPTGVADTAAPTSPETAAIVVVYRQAQDIERTLQQLRLVTPHVVVVDNGERPFVGLAAITQALQCGYIHGANLGGLAGAYNKALAWLQGHQAQATQVVFLDEDSDPASLPAFLADSRTRATLAQPSTAAVSPAYRDRATGLRGRYMWLQRFRLGFNPREFSGLREVAFVINSMSVWRLAALQQIGAFNQSLAVDHIDTEYCLRARHQGLHVYVNGSFEFPHAIGERKKYKFFGMEVQAGGHSAQRRCMIGRNTAWLARRWALREPAFAALCLARLAYEAIGIAIAEPQAGAKLWALLRGVSTGLFMRMPRA